MRIRARVVSVLCVVVMAGCDPGFTLQGTIARSDGSPAAGVTVHVSCGGSLQAKTTSDANGRFVGYDRGWYPSTCVIEAIPPGGAPITWPMMPACTKKRGQNACLEVTAHLRLP